METVMKKYRRYSAVACDDTDVLKRRVRKLKHFERTIRSKNNLSDDIPLVWDKFFDLQNCANNKVLYTLPKLVNMSREAYKEIVDAFFARVYYEVYALRGIIDEVTIYDHRLLAQLDLPPIADEIAVKKKFRELAKECHPDAGGDHERFIALMEIYGQLINPE